MAAYEVLLLNTAIPQIQAAQSGDTYVVPRDIAFSTVASFAAGAEATPSIVATGDTNTGIWFPAADTVAISTGGISRMRLDSSGNLGLGVTPSAWSLLKAVQIGNASFAGYSGTGYLMTNAYFDGSVYKYTSSNYANLYTQNNSVGQHAWYIAASGTANSALVTSGASYTVVALGSSTLAQWQAFFNDSSNNPLTVTPTLGQVLTGNATGTLLGGGLVTQNISFTQAMTLDASGNLLVGTASSGQGRLMVKQGASTVASGVAVQATSNDSYLSLWNDGSVFNIEAYYSSTGSYQPIAFRTSNTERARITSTGGFETRPAANGHAIFNEDGVDADFRVEGDTDTHLIFADASADQVGIGTNNTDNFKLAVKNGGGNLARFTNGATQTMDVVLDSSGFILQNPNDGYIAFKGSSNERARITSGGIFQVSSGGSVQVGGTAARATTAGTNRLDIFNGTAPVGTLTDGISIYSSSGEAYVMDAAGNATLFSPHDAETNEWIFHSKHTPTGKVLKIDVERLLKFVNDHFGLDAVHEFVEK